MFSEAYAEAKAKRALRTLRQTPSEPIRYTAMNPFGEVWDFSRRTGGKLRIGKPRKKWTAESFNILWNIVRKHFPEH